MNNLAQMSDQHIVNITYHKLKKLIKVCLESKLYKLAAMSLPNDFLRPRSSRPPITLEKAEADAALEFGGFENALLCPY